MRRATFEHDGLTFSYLEHGDAGGHVILLLHAHWMGASDFERVMVELPARFRVLALDQRGHGQTSHGGVHAVDAYLRDIDALLDHADVKQPVVLLGHSFGGMVANLYTARRPGRVRGLVMEDIDVARDDQDDPSRNWAGHYPTREALEAKIGERLAPYLQKSITRDAEGFRLTFDPEEVLASERALNGDHWAEWTSHACPALIIQGRTSKVVPGEALEEMERRRPNTRRVVLDAGHSVHIDAPGPFVAALNEFLTTV